MKIDYPSLLNDTQLEAVTTESAHVRIIAGAGSGKTRVLTYRIAYLIDELGNAPESILAVTFTNKAANEMKERVARLVPSAAPFLQVSTFHSFCARFLRREAYLLGYPAGFTIFDDEDQERLLKDIAESWGYKKSDPILKEGLHYIGKKKTKGLYPEDITIKFGSFQEEKECLRFYTEYENRKRTMLCMDFDDLILFSIKILEEFDDVRKYWAYRFNHILVDEFQDTNDVQYRLMQLLSRPDTNIYVVGDPDQTIYTWRGANQKIILDFPVRYPDYIDIVLNRNYRSTKNILGAANKLISHNKQRVPKDLFTEGDDGVAVLPKRFESAQEEADFIVAEINRIADKNYPPRYDNIAVLYRSSYLTRPLEAAFGANGVPYRVFGGLRFYQRREVKDVLAYFRVLLNPLDDVAFTRIYNVPRRGIGEASFNQMKKEASELGLSLYQYACELERHETELPKRVVVALIAMAAIMQGTSKRLTDNLEAYSSVLKDMINEMGYYQYIAEDQGIDEDRAANVNALFDDINAYISKNPDSSFEEYLQNIALLTSQDDMNGGNYVSLMTIHIAKGLEFDNVFVMGMNQGAFPSDRSIADTGRDGMEEERRLAYVAFTRAKQRLILTCNSGFSYVSGGRSLPSMFFEEAGLAFPRESMYSSVYPGGYAGRGKYGNKQTNNGWRKVGYSNSDPFDDGDHYDPFASSKPSPAPVARPKKENGITDWRVGDRVHHEKFGDGTVVQLLDSSIFIVQFDDGGKRTLVSSHPMIRRITKPGGVA